MRVRDKSLLFIAIPAIPFVLVAPAALSLTFGLVQKGWAIPPLLIATPFWLGLVSVTGYIRALTLIEEPSRPVPAWSIASVGLALIASLGGAIAGLPLLLPTPFALASAACCVVLLLKSHHRSRNEALASSRDGPAGT